jgi:transaldolase
MSKINYLQWLGSQTKTSWWHDSADPDELAEALKNGAVGVTTNPLLVRQSLFARPKIWAETLSGLPKELDGAEKAEAIMRKITQKIADMMMPVYKRSGGADGYVCAQVNPLKAGDAETMYAMALRLHDWAPNIAVKLPATAAGIDVLEECAAAGITVTLTVSFTVAQVLAIAERYRKGLQRAKKTDIKPGKCYAVLMIGRLDDYLRDVAMDNKCEIQESDIREAGVAVIKRAYEIYKQQGYEAVLMTSAMRGTYHVEEPCGAAIVNSIHPKTQIQLLKITEPFCEYIEERVDAGVIERLMRMPEFVKAYEPDGMKPEEFIGYGVTQKTLCQFVETGWLPLEAYKL